MAENVLQIKENGQYKNIDLRDMDNGDSVILTKAKYAEGVEREGKYGTFYTVSAEYNGEEVGFIISKEDQHAAYASTGGVGDKVKVTMAKEIRKLQNGREYVAKDLTFEKVE